VCLFAKRLEDRVMRLAAAQFSALLEGLDWKRVRAKETPAPALAGWSAT